MQNLGNDKSDKTLYLENDCGGKEHNVMTINENRSFFPSKHRSFKVR